ncbi:unnamed protein product, partial [Rotaria sp. Silwood1]
MINDILVDICWMPSLSVFVLLTIHSVYLYDSIKSSPNFSIKVDAFQPENRSHVLASISPFERDIYINYHTGVHVDQYRVSSTSQWTLEKGYSKSNCCETEDIRIRDVRCDSQYICLSIMQQDDFKWQLDIMSRGCLANFEETKLSMVLYDDTLNQIKYITQTRITQLTDLQILTLFLSLSATQLVYNDKFINILSNKKITFLHYLGRGSSSFVFYSEAQQEQRTKFVLKISRQNCSKEKFIIEEMNKIKPKNMNLIQCMDMDFDDENADYLIAFNLRGVKLDGIFIQRFLDDTQLLINTWKQANLCYIHSDIRIGNTIMNDNMLYINDYSSAVQPKTPNYYQGCLSTASNSILKILQSNNEKISLYYTDDGISFLKSILLLKPYFQHYTSNILKAIADNETCDILLIYEYTMKLFKDKNIIKTLAFLEEDREILSIDDLNDIIIRALETEKTDDYHIDEYLQ